MHFFFTAAILKPFSLHLSLSQSRPLSQKWGGAFRGPTLAFTNSNNYDVVDDEDDGDDVINANSDDGDKK